MAENMNHLTLACPSCGTRFQTQEQASSIRDLPGLPAGVKFDPTDQELLDHLESKVVGVELRRHPLVDDFIPTLGGEDGICGAHPERLPGVSADGAVRHFFHRPARAYTTGTRKRRKVVHSPRANGSASSSPLVETRWHKTGKTRPVLAAGGRVRGHKKILVLYASSTCQGRWTGRRRAEKTSWVMHQYHLGPGEEEREGELVVSKVFYQTQPRQCSSTAGGGGSVEEKVNSGEKKPTAVVEFCNSSLQVILPIEQPPERRGGAPLLAAALKVKGE